MRTLVAWIIQIIARCFGWKIDGELVDFEKLIVWGDMLKPLTTFPIILKILMKLQNIDEMIILPIQYDRIIDGTNRHKFTLPDQHDQILHLLDNSSVNKNIPPDVFPRVRFHYFSSTPLEWVHLFLWYLQGFSCSMYCFGVWNVVIYNGNQIEWYFNM